MGNRGRSLLDRNLQGPSEAAKERPRYGGIRIEFGHRKKRTLTHLFVNLGKLVHCDI